MSFLFPSRQRGCSQTRRGGAVVSLRGFRDTLLRRSVLECAAVPMRSLMVTTYCLVRCGPRLMVAQVSFLRCNGCLHLNT